MSDDKLRQELLYMVRLTTKYDFTRMEVVEGILRLENERRILDSVFGKRFKARIFDIAAGVATDENCVICGQHAQNQVICQHCLDTIGGSNYAQSKIKVEEKPAKVNLRFIGKICLVVLLSVILCIQIWILSLAQSIPDRNPSVAATVSSFDLTPVSNEEEALAQLQLDFPAEDGYEISFGRMDSDYVGRFLLEKGDCCLDIEEKLTDDERYDYFFKEDVYVFYISQIQQYSARIGVAEVNSAGAILIMGKFNDGRRTDSFYKYR